MRFGASLGAASGAGEYSSLESAIVATVESLEVPPGVDVDSAANALAAYHVPEPGTAAGGASLAALALLRRLRRVFV